MAPSSIMSYQFMNVLVMTNASVKQAIQKAAGIATTDYCILQALIMLDRPVGMSEYQDFLMLRKNTISMAISRLEKGGLVSKEISSSDLRKCDIAITGKGAAVARKSSIAIRDMLLEGFWKTYDDERVNWGMVIDTRAYFASGGVANLFDNDPASDDFVLPTWIVALKNLEQMWSAVVKRCSGLSLSEFRVLDHLDHTGRPFGSYELSDALGIETSAMSRVMRSLRASGLVSTAQSSVDKRSFVSGITPGGAQLLESTRQALAEATDGYYAVISEEERARLSAWHRTMFDNNLKRESRR